MALITTSASLVRQYNAFTGLSATERSQSGIARAEVVYYATNDDWPASGAGNNKLYKAGPIDLPKDFGYVITDCYVAVERVTGGKVECEMVGDFLIAPGGTLGPQIRALIEATPSKQGSSPSTAVGSIPADEYNSNIPSLTGDRGSIVYQMLNKPTGIIYPFASTSYTSTPNPASQWTFTIGDQKQNGDQHRVTTYVRFLQYDIDQSYNYVIQSPQLTR